MAYLNMPKRTLAYTPYRRTKRRRMMPRRRAPRVPRRILPEVKFLGSQSSWTTGTNDAYVSMPLAMTQGSGDYQFVGSHFRMLRARLTYDFSQLTLTDAVRVICVIPKDPSNAPALTTNTGHLDHSVYTVLYDAFLPVDPSTLVGQVDIKGPINVHMNQSGGTCYKNNIYWYLYSQSSGSLIGASNTARWAIWFTDT